MTECSGFFFSLVDLIVILVNFCLHSIVFQSHAMENGHYELEQRLGNSTRNILFSFQHFELTIEQKTVHTQNVKTKTENSFDKMNEGRDEGVVH